MMLNYFVNVKSLSAELNLEDQEHWKTKSNNLHQDNAKLGPQTDELYIPLPGVK